MISTAPRTHIIAILNVTPPIMLACARSAPNAGAPFRSIIMRRGALIMTTPSTRPDRRRSNSAIRARSSIGPTLASKGIDPAAVRAAQAMSAAISTSRYTCVLPPTDVRAGKIPFDHLRAGVPRFSGERAKVVDEIPFAGVAVGGADDRYDHDLIRP